MKTTATIILALILSTAAAVQYGEMTMGAAKRAGTMKVTLRVDGHNVTRSIDVDQGESGDSKGQKLRDAFDGVEGIRASGTGAVAHFEVVQLGVPKNISRVTRVDGTGEPDTVKVGKIPGSAAAPIGAYAPSRELADQGQTLLAIQGEPLYGESIEGGGNGSLRLIIDGYEITAVIGSQTTAETAIRSIADQLLVQGYEPEVFVGLHFRHPDGVTVGAELDDVSNTALLHSVGDYEEGWPW